jgi:ParB family chromosome partitioning protein
MTTNRAAAVIPKKKTTSSGLGLGSETDLSRFLLEDDVHSHGEQRPMELDLSLIDEDPHQPRTVFKEELLQEMAQTIRARGVKNPISVHRNPEQEGRFIINDGARRYRASKLAGKKTIPAFIDSDFSKIDQIIVNAHHETFTSREWAVLIDQEAKKGKKQIQIAEELGKSQAFITHHATLLKLPDAITEVFNTGRCTDATTLYELRVLWKRNKDEVEAWLRDGAVEITRGTVRKLREFLEKSKETEPAESDETGHPESSVDVEDEGKEPPNRTESSRKEDAAKLRKAKVIVQHEGREARLILNRRPSASGLAWLKYEDDGSEFECALDEMKLIALTEG